MQIYKVRASICNNHVINTTPTLCNELTHSARPTSIDLSHCPASSFDFDVVKTADDCRQQQAPSVSLRL